MSPRTGWPKVENPINIRTSVRLDKETDEKLNQYCKQHGITKEKQLEKAFIFFWRKKNRAF